MSNKKNKVLLNLKKCIEHDFGFYNPVWKWDSLPPNIKNNYDLIEGELIQWQNKGYIKIYIKEEIKYLKIFEIPII